MIHSVPVGFSIDGSRGIRDPRGMYGDKPGGHHARGRRQSGAGPQSRRPVGARCHLEIEARVVVGLRLGPGLPGRGRERDLGVTCIDMGGGTTTIAVFLGGHLVITDAIPVGGVHVTNDIARGLVDAARPCRAHEDALWQRHASPADDREILKVPLVGEDEDGAANQVPRSMLVQIIRPRLEETFEMVRGQLEAAGLRQAGRPPRGADRRRLADAGRPRAGGAGARQAGAARAARRHSTGCPKRPAGRPSRPAPGLLRYAAADQAEAPAQEHRMAEAMAGTARSARLGGWLRKNF